MLYLGADQRLQAYDDQGGRAYAGTDWGSPAASRAVMASSRPGSSLWMGAVQPLLRDGETVYVRSTVGSNPAKPGARNRSPQSRISNSYASTGSGTVLRYGAAFQVSVSWWP